jgi:hypothetical protein
MNQPTDIERTRLLRVGESPVYIGGEPLLGAAEKKRSKNSSTRQTI